jgi:hypothetical protein
MAGLMNHLQNQPTSPDIQGMWPPVWHLIFDLVSLPQNNAMVRFLRLFFMIPDLKKTATVLPTLMAILRI